MLSNTSTFDNLRCLEVFSYPKDLNNSSLTPLFNEL